MDSTTISPNTFKLLDQVTCSLVAPFHVKGVVYDEVTRMATFTPARPLEDDKRYGAIITARVRYKAGNRLEQDKMWHFHRSVHTN